MVRAYVAVIAAAGTAERIVSAARGFDGVAEAHAVAGDFDVVVEAETEGMDDLRDLVISSIQGLDGVGTTRTYIVLD